MVKIVWVVDGEKDNVATVLDDQIKAGATIPVEAAGRILKVTVKQGIPYGHKVAIKPIAFGATVYKYGLSIGCATRDIGVGEHVHVHNIESNRGRGDLAIAVKGEVTSAGI